MASIVAMPTNSTCINFRPLPSELDESETRAATTLHHCSPAAFDLHAKWPLPELQSLRGLTSCPALCSRSVSTLDSARAFSALTLTRCLAQADSLPGHSRICSSWNWIVPARWMVVVQAVVVKDGCREACPTTQEGTNACREGRQGPQSRSSSCIFVLFLPSCVMNFWVSLKHGEMFSELRSTPSTKSS